MCSVTRADASSLCCVFVGPQGRSSRHKIHRTPEKTSFLALTHAAVPSLALVCTPRLTVTRVFGLILQLLNSSGQHCESKRPSRTMVFNICLSVWLFVPHKWWWDYTPSSCRLEDGHLCWWRKTQWGQNGQQHQGPRIKTNFCKWSKVTSPIYDEQNFLNKKSAKPEIC